jgi:hypothetical protein
MPVRNHDSPTRTSSGALNRAARLSVLAGRDAVAVPASRILHPAPPEPEAALERAIAWLCRTHDATGRRGSAKGYSLLHGWLAAYPETTGYVIGTLLEYSERVGARPDLVERAREMGAWETEIPEPDGGVMLGHAETYPRRSIVFNTGMVLHGWLDLHEYGHDEDWPAAERAAAFLTANLRQDGTWSPEFEYNHLAHTYNSRVAWAMLRWARHAGSSKTEEAAVRQLDWVLGRQRSNGWFDDCVFKVGTDPSTHAIAYTLRGLLESHVVLGDSPYLDAVVRTAEVLIRKLEVIGRLPANWSADWRPTVSYECLTGNAQLGGVFLRLFQICGDARYLNAGLKGLDFALVRQQRGPRDVDGAIAGSFPLWGRYAPLQYPNWATKFLADSLMIRADALAAGS